MKMKELVKLLESSVFICDCVTDDDFDTVVEEEFSLEDVGCSQNGHSFYSECFVIKKGIKTIATFNTIKELQKNKNIMEMEVETTKIHLSQFKEHYFSFLNYENNSEFTFYVI